MDAPISHVFKGEDIFIAFAISTAEKKIYLLMFKRDEIFEDFEHLASRIGILYKGTLMIDSF